MLFSGATFLYLFLPLTLGVYYVTPQRGKNTVLLLASLLFYAFGEPVYVLLLVFSSLSDWAHSLWIEQRRGTPAAKVLLISSIVLNLGMLGFFKYADFFIASLNGVLGTAIPLPNVPLPIGISFFTFQTMSYTIDVYKGRAHAEKNLASFATFVCLFPQLIAGPIVRYTDIAAELKTRCITTADVYAGIRRFIVGLGKKVLLANTLGELYTAYHAAAAPGVLFAWLGAIAFMLQIYFDFSGYSDMAIGLGRMLGFTFPENFDYPYTSRSVTEFWRRWHMTLGGWFRDYVYIPLGGNRVPKARWLLNILTVWLLTGLWHGAAWNFVAWGLFFAVLLVLEKWLFAPLLAKCKPLAHLYTLLAVLLSFVVFSADSITGAWADLTRMFGAGGSPLFTAEGLYALRSYLVPLLLGIFGALPLVKGLWQKLDASEHGQKALAVLEPLGVLALLILCTACLVDGSFNPFLYFRF